MFTVHWSPVSRDSDGATLFALWPAPVNHDVCFRNTGFTDFGDANEAWDADAEGLLNRLLKEMSTYGEPRLASAAMVQARSWFRSLFRKPTALSLLDQITLPIQWDHLPDCVVEFGESGVSLRTGRGHHIFWIRIPSESNGAFHVLVQKVAGFHPLFQTELRWEALASQDRRNHAIRWTRDKISYGRKFKVASRWSPTRDDNRIPQR